MEFTYVGVVPDAIVCAKSMSAGYAPISAIIAKKQLADSLDYAEHVFTFAGHPVSCVAALCVIELIEEYNLVSRSQRAGI